MTGLIRLKRNFTAAAAPGSLQPGEVAVNVTDKRLWVGDAGSVPVEFPFSGGGGGGGGGGLSVVNFGVGGSTNVELVLTGITGILITSSVVAHVACVSTADHNEDEHALEEIDVRAGRIVAGVGFSIFAKTRNTPLYGNWTVAWNWR